MLSEKSIQNNEGLAAHPKRLVTMKKCNELTGASVSFIKQLIREKKLIRYKINSASYVSLQEFEQIAISKAD